ncbi:MAG TPA: DUF1524 domain-containing protein [Candidatus Rothia avicola]|uniref:DUF1524 domain-containing protein n=1 Tax=Candidatus Rothia avicola TaxID=2840478 RepID=A0A9D2CQM9_9MICC|nr:DUF1524 domain-containing protein [Candidatus Rothia avicola]
MELDVRHPSKNLIRTGRGRSAPKTPVGKGLLGCLGCLGLIIVLFVGSAVIAGVVQAFSGGGSTQQAETSSSSAYNSEGATPTPAITADSDGQIYDEGNEESITLPGENPDFAENAVPAVPNDTQNAPDAQKSLEKLNQLEVKGRAPKTGYDRSLFGNSWVDTDKNGCDTRNDMLRRDLVGTTTKPGTRGCVVLSGSLSDPYTGSLISFMRGKGTSEAVQIDHVVALSDAWQKGAQKLTEEQRIAFANDPINLLAVDGPTNQQKSDGDAATWLPPKTSFRCEYVSKQIDVKAKYGLWVTEAEKVAMTDVLTSPDCGARAEIPQSEPAYEEQVAPAPIEESAPAYYVPPVEQAPVVPEAPVQYFKNCTEAHKAGRYDIPATDPAYRPALDGNKDGVACESR